VTPGLVQQASEEAIMSGKTNPRPLVMGAETELALSGTVSSAAVRPEELLGPLLQAARRFPHLPSLEAGGGLFLQSGGRLYGEINGHPEYATPECRTPRQVALYDRVGERLLGEAALRLRCESGGRMDLTLTKSNLCPLHPDVVTHGNHESYTCWISLAAAAEALIPHLVTRLPYAGSGCLSSARSGLGFELSQRARHLTRITSESTTADRGIFCTRVRYERDHSPMGWTRAHLIGKDSQRAPLGTYLSFGVTALLFWVLNHDGQLGAGLALRDPLETLWSISRNPSLDKTVRLADGRMMTPVEIQLVYLEECQTFARNHELPDWAGEVLQRWQATLAQLADNPLDLAGQLDAYTKLWIYQHELDRLGFTWSDVLIGQQLVKQARTNAPPALVQALIHDSPELLRAQHRGAFHKAKQLLAKNGDRALERLSLAVRMQALDFEYHKLGGLFDELAAAGLVDTSIAPDESVAHAMSEPPPDTRAAARGALVREHHRVPGWAAAWSEVIGAKGEQLLLLDDPFSAGMRAASRTDASRWTRALRAWAHSSARET
jgi:hypothetical protein